MYQLIIFASSNLFNYDPITNVRNKTSESYETLVPHVEAYKSAFEQKTITELHVIILEIDNGAVHVLMNEHGKNPLQERLQINPKAAEIKKTKKKDNKTVYYDPNEGPLPVNPQMFFTTTTAGNDGG